LRDVDLGVTAWSNSWGKEKSICTDVRNGGVPEVVLVSYVLVRS